MTELVLASASPRRADLLRRLGFSFGVRPASLDETPRPDEDPHHYVSRLALEKAVATHRPGELVLAADTVVVLDRDLLGKPDSPADARRMLERLSGQRHAVLTGVAAVGPNGRQSVDVDETWVEIRALTEDEIDWYVATGEPLDKAGAYAIQGLGALFVDRIEGNYSNVVGFPLPTVRRLVAALGLELLEHRTPCPTE